MSDISLSQVNAADDSEAAPDALPEVDGTATTDIGLYTGLAEEMKSADTASSLEQERAGTNHTARPNSLPQSKWKITVALGSLETLLTAVNGFLSANPTLHPFSATVSTPVYIPKHGDLITAYQSRWIERENLGRDLCARVHRDKSTRPFYDGEFLLFQDKLEEMGVPMSRNPSAAPEGQEYQDGDLAGKIYTCLPSTQPDFQHEAALSKLKSAETCVEETPMADSWHDMGVFGHCMEGHGWRPHSRHRWATEIETGKGKVQTITIDGATKYYLP